MLVIHGIWAYGALQVWAEDSARPAQAPPRVGRPSRAPRPHPFAVAPGELADALAGAGAGDLAAKAVDDELTLRLPSVTDGPLASPELVRPSAEAAAETPAARRVALAAWRVPVLVFEPAAAIELLPALAGLAASPGPAVGELVTDESALAGELAVGGSIGYLAAIARFADDLVSRGRVLPALTSEDGGYAARWRPVLSAADAQRARELAAAIPAACRAAADTAPGPLLAGMLDALADATARTRLPGALLPARRGRRPAQIPVIERTVASLTASDPLVEVEGAADEREARELTPAFAEWLAAAARPAGPVRTCFRLVEPPDPGPEMSDADGAATSPDPGAPMSDADGAATSAEVAAPSDWQVELSLQSAEDPSLMVPALDVWDGAGFGWLAGDADPEEELLAGLGAAARLFPALDGALREAAPTRLTLDTAAALDFLRETGPLLSGAGFGVLLPDWARKARLGLKLTAKSSTGSSPSAGPSRFGLQDLVDFRYDLAVGDEVLSPAELDELARLKVPLVRIRGQWVELDDRHLKAALKFFEGGRSGTMTAAEVLTAAIGAGAG